MALSVEAGHPVDCDRCATFADGMAVRVAIPLAVEELRRGTPMMMVSERAIARAVGDFAAAGIRVEGSAAASLAAFRELPPEHEPDGPDRDRPQHRRRPPPARSRGARELPRLGPDALDSAASSGEGRLNWSS